MSFNLENTVVNINSDVVEEQTYLRDIWLAESECHLQIKTSTYRKQCQLEITEQHIAHALHSDSGSNRHVSTAYYAARSCPRQAGIQPSPCLPEKVTLIHGPHAMSACLCVNINK